MTIIFLLFLLIHVLFPRKFCLKSNQFSNFPFPLWKDYTNYRLMKTYFSYVLTMLFVTIFGVLHAQEKVIDRSGQEAKLVQVQNEILQIEEKIAAIQSRIDQTAPEHITQTTYDRIEEYRSQLVMLRRIETSTKAVLVDESENKEPTLKKATN